MATLKSSTAQSVAANTVSTAAGAVAIKTNMIDSQSRYLRKVEYASSAVGYNLSTAWSTRTELSTLFTGFLPGSLLQMTYYVPARNDSTSWGGLYIEPQVEFNSDGAWKSLGCCGYDGGVMIFLGQTIASYQNSILIDPEMASEYSVKFRFAMRSYDGTTTINNSHDINNVSGTATIMPGVSGTQHYHHLIVEEYALWSN